MRKAINFDIDTKEYEKVTGKPASTAYEKIKKYMLKNGFEHRQGSGYISINSLTDSQIVSLVLKMTNELDWLDRCVEQIDVTNIGKRHSVKDIIHNQHKKMK